MYSLILAECRVPEGSVGELPWTRYAWSLLDRVKFGRLGLCFFRPFGS
jgi:hypothetical protein